MTFQKGQRAWNKGIKRWWHSPTEIKKGQHLSPATEFKRGPEELHPRWKGNRVGYTALHDWVRKKLGTPKACSKCGTTSRRMYHWANISGEYKRVVSDWTRLCVSCHSLLDRSRENSHYANKS